MFLQKINKIKQKINNIKFKNQVKQEQKKIFIDTIESDKKWKFNKKRKSIKFNFPKIENSFIRNNFKKVILGSFLFIILLMILSLFTPVFSVKKINIEIKDDNYNLIDLNIAYKSVDYFRNKNLILIESQEIFDQITNYQKNIIEVEIDKLIFKRELNLKIKSSKALFYTIINWKKYVITENWVFVNTNDKIIKDLQEIRVQLSQKNTNFVEYKQVLNKTYLEKITKIRKNIEQNILWLKVKNIFYFEKEREVHFDINNELKIIFDINVEDVEEQEKKIIVFSKEHKNIIKDDSIYYIDLRVPNKVYYCEKEFIWSCQKNLKTIYDIYE